MKKNFGAVVFLLASALFFVPVSPALCSPLFEIHLPLTLEESASAVLPDGRTFSLGRVAGLPETTRWPGYTASKWALPGTVAASAVNAVHLTLSIEKEAGRTFSILPLTTLAPAAGKAAFVTLDVPAGTGFFGGWAPPVGTRVSVKKKDGSLLPLEVRGFPSPGEELIFFVEELPRPYILDMENRPGGRIIGWYADGPKILARVIRPVHGVGRFGGTEFQGRGRIRANHSGVIDVSTTPRGTVGGFQIIPLLHAESKEMGSAWALTQWMIAGSESGEPLPGSSPLFRGNLLPGSQGKDTLWDMWSTEGRKPLVLCRLDGGEWEKLPEEGGRQDGALGRVTHIRIYSPFTAEPQGD